jgi:hypothetical protein
MKKLIATLVLALSLVGGSQAAADSSWLDAGFMWVQESSLDGVTWE